MPALRLTLIALLLLNLLALAANVGWLGTSTPRGEPERLSNQLHPDRIMLIGDIQAHLDGSSDQAAPPADHEKQQLTATTAAAPAPSPACIVYSGISGAYAEAIERIVADAAPDISVERHTQSPPEDWWVRVSPAANRQAAEQRSRRLREKGVTDLYIIREEGPDRHAISLGLFRTESRARRHLEELSRLGIDDAAVMPRTPGRYALTLSGLDTQLQPLRERLRLTFPDMSAVECA